VFLEKVLPLTPHDPGMPQLLYDMAKVHLAMGNLGEALRYLKKALRINTVDPLLLSEINCAIEWVATRAARP